MQEPKQQGAFDIVKVAMTYTQLGLSVVAPLILSVLCAHWIRERFELDGWVTFVGLVIGLIAMIFTLIRYFQKILQESRKRQEALQSGKTDDDPQKGSL